MVDTASFVGWGFETQITEGALPVTLNVSDNLCESTEGIIFGSETIQ